MKVKNIAYIFVAAAIGCATASCSHDDLDSYSGPKAMLYIQEYSGFDIYGNATGCTDHTDADFTKIQPEFALWTQSFQVRMAGEVVDYDRPYSLRIEADSTTAIEGVDFDIEQNEFMIKAGKASDVVRVRLHRNDRIKVERVRISFLLEPNEYFSIDIPEFKNTTSWSAEGKMMDATRYYFTMSEFYERPEVWNNWNLDEEFGPYSPKKFSVINTLFNWVYDDWTHVGNIATDKLILNFMPFYGLEFQRYLQKMADEGTPEREVDGSLMQPGNKYTVDYSKYEN